MNWFIGLFRRKSYEKRLDSELRFDLEERARGYVASGLNPKAARRQAVIDLGGLEQIKEECRDQRSGVGLDHVAQDLRFGLRMLRRNPTFASVAVLSLALAIGAATSVFSLVNVILLGSLPVPNPQDLRVICWSASETHMNGYTGSGGPDIPGRKAGSSFSTSVFRELREKVANQAEIFGFHAVPGLARVHGVPRETVAMTVSGNFFSGLGVMPGLGTLLGPEDEMPGGPFRAVLSYQFWDRAFGRDPTVIGQLLVFNGRSFVISGVLPIGFRGLEPGAAPGLYISMIARDQVQPFESLEDPSFWWLPLMGRLRPGVSSDELASHLDVALTGAAGTLLDEPKAVVTDGRDGPMWDRKEYRHQLQLLFAAVAVVVMVSCANVSGLLLARGFHRQHELAIRGAIGADRGRLVRQLLTESSLLSLLGGFLGLVLAYWGRSFVANLLTGPFAWSPFAVKTDLKVLTFTLAVTVLTTLLAGLYPALTTTPSDPLNGLRRQNATGTAFLRPGQLLVGAQIALSVLLVAGAGLYLRTLMNLVSIKSGFDLEYLLYFKLDPADAGYPGNRWVKYFENVQRAVGTVPGVQSVAEVSYVPLGGANEGQSFTILDRPFSKNEQAPAVEYYSVSETFLSTLKVPILVGRGLLANDTAASQPVAVINDAFSKKYFPNESPLGHSLQFGSKVLQIVGVCRDFKGAGVKQPMHPMLYLPYRQLATGHASLIVRTEVAPWSLFASVRRAVKSVDTNVLAEDLGTLKELRDRQFLTERMFSISCGSLAVLDDMGRTSGARGAKLSAL